eukprot:15357232-Ditylum_brightwellii.AAC.2
MNDIAMASFDSCFLASSNKEASKANYYHLFHVKTKSKKHVCKMHRRKHFQHQTAFDARNDLFRRVSGVWECRKITYIISAVNFNTKKKITYTPLNPISLSDLYKRNQDNQEKLPR